MRIFNCTNEDIVIDGWTIPPEKLKEPHERVFDTINIHADFGSAIITCEYKDRSIHCFGNLEVCRRPHEHDIRLDEYDVIKKGDEMKVIGYTENNNIVLCSPEGLIFYLTVPDCKEKVKVMNEALEANGSSTRIKPVVVVREGNCDKIYYLPQKKEE